ncbi:TlpA family protein disulfide reductase [Spirosoma validum]|nr:redoxin domain-containing protein [Spirosoma validum]
MKDDPNGYHLEAVIDEYGQASAYKIRPTTPEERETHRFNDRNPALRPKIGEPVPEFVMKGIDDKVYRSTELKGHVVILSFWVSLSKPFWGTNQAKGYADALRPYQSETDPISLGILRESKEDIVNVMATETLPFIPIPNSYGFHEKFHVTLSPAFIVIDRAGNVAAYIEGMHYDQLQKTLQAVSR